MPLKKGKSKKTINRNIREMMNSSTFGTDQDSQTRRAMAIAAAMKKAGKSKKK